MKIYRIGLCEQYNYIRTSPKRKIIKLKREKSYIDKHVYYFLMEIEKNIDSGKETTMNTTRYTGKDRKKAFEDFETYKKNNPNAEAIKEIEKGRFEK